VEDVRNGTLRAVKSVLVSIWAGLTTRFLPVEHFEIQPEADFTYGLGRGTQSPGKSVEALAFLKKPTNHN
jgi:hypothetical protein